VSAVTYVDIDLKIVLNFNVNECINVEFCAITFFVIFVVQLCNGRTTFWADDFK